MDDVSLLGQSSTPVVAPPGAFPADLSSQRPRDVAGERNGLAPLRILLLAPHPFFQNRGTPLAERAVLEVLSAEGHRVDVLTFHEGEDVTIPNCRIHRIPRIPGVRNIRPGWSPGKLVSDAVMFVAAMRMVRRERYDLIHAVEESAFMAAAAQRLYGTPFIYDMDSSLVEQMIAKFPALRVARRAMDACEQLAIRSSVGVVTVCQSLVETVRRHDGAKLVACVEDASLIDGAARPVESLRETLGAAGPIVMYVGNLERYQGIDLLLEGFALASRDVADARLVIVGGTDGLIASYSAKAAQLGIVERVHFVGPRPVSMLGGYLRQADVLVSPRLTGTNTPMKVYSYLDSGTAVLATRLRTHTQVLDDRIALLAAPEPAAFARGMVTLLRDAPLRARLGARGRERVQREYTPQATARKLLHFYRTVEERLATAGTTARRRLLPPSVLTTAGALMEILPELVH